jgi:hypothetical protein
MGTGVVASFVLAIVTITAKRVRNGRLEARGEPGIKDVMFVPLYGLYGPAGAIAGGVAAGIREEGVVTGIAAGVALPVVLTVVILIVVAMQTFGRA